ncbi:MAG TPA: hypothetical protein VK452_02625 [Dissulfurispiraceae bacterium]|nr:hypothetical protein [Dissulfurispiraceae bacterium]
MKKAVASVAAAMLLLILGITGASAQFMERDEHSTMQNCDMHRGIGMTGSMGMRDHMGMMPENLMEARHHVMGMMMELGLDEKQTSAIQNIIDSTVKELIRKRSELLIAKIDLEGLLHADPVDLKAAETKMKQIESMKTDMFMTHLNALEEAKSLLTPVQKMKLKEMTEMHRHMPAGHGVTPRHDYSDKDADRPIKK